jgi:amidase
VRPTSEFAYCSATQLTTAMAAGEVSATELVTQAIARIERYDGDLNAICVPDFDRALAAATDADSARAAGDARPLLGVPMTVKESFNVAGLPTTWGFPDFKDFVASEDAVAVARLKAAGAIVLGKTNVPLGLGDLQSYNDIYGTTNNPWDLGRTPGGSSGGSAAALAAGFGALSIGSDIGGSLRAPAHFCGVYAHKASFGLLPTRGHTPPPGPPLPSDRDLAVIGPMARTARDLALMFDVLATPDELGLGAAYRLDLQQARHDRLSDFRVLVLDTHPLIPSASSVRNAINAIADGLATSGATVTRHSSTMPDPVEAARLYMRLLMSNVAANFPASVYARMQTQAAGLDADDDGLAAERLRGAVLSYRDWLAADQLRAHHRQQWRQLFTEVDVVLCPVTPTPAFPHDHDPAQWTRHIDVDGTPYPYPDQLIWAGVATAPGLPSTVVPIGQSEAGLPIGAQLIGPMFEDRTPIRLAELLEAEYRAFQPPALE